MVRSLVQIAVAVLLASAGSAQAEVKALILPLDNMSESASLGWLSEGVEVQISEQLAFPGLDVVGRNTAAPLVEALDLPPNAPLSRASMIRVAQECSADFLLMGSYSGTPEKLQLRVSVLNMKTMKLSPTIVANGPLTLLPQMENQLAWDLVGQLEVPRSVSRDEFRQRTRVVPNPAYSLYIRSLSAMDEDEQAKMLAKAVEEYDLFPEAQYLLAKYYFQRGECAKCIHPLEVSLGRQYNYLSAEYMLGTCHLKQEALDESIRAYSRLLSFVRAPELFNNIGVAYLRKGDDALALQHLLDARALLEGNLTIELNVALARILQGNYPAAQDVLERTIRAYPNVGLLRYLLSLVLANLLDTPGSQSALQQARNLGADPDKLQSQELKGLARIFPNWEPKR